MTGHVDPGLWAVLTYGTLAVIGLLSLKKRRPAAKDRFHRDTEGVGK